VHDANTVRRIVSSVPWYTTSQAITASSDPSSAGRSVMSASATGAERPASSSRLRHVSTAAGEKSEPAASKPSAARYSR